MDNGTKGRYSPFVDKPEGWLKIIVKREKQKSLHTGSENLEFKYERERQYQQEIHETQRQTCGRKNSTQNLNEKNVRDPTARLTKLRISPFKGAPIDWVRFHNTLVTTPTRSVQKRNLAIRWR